MLGILFKCIAVVFLVVLPVLTGGCSGNTSSDSGTDDDADALVVAAQALYTQISELISEMTVLAEDSADSGTSEAQRFSNQEEIDELIEEISVIAGNSKFADRLILQGTEPSTIATEDCDSCTYPAEEMRNGWNRITDAVNALADGDQTVTFTYSFIQMGTDAGLDSSNNTVYAVEAKDWTDGSVTHDEFKEDIRRGLALWEELFERVFSSENGFGHNLTMVLEDLGEETGTSTGIGANATYSIPGTENLGDLRYGMKEFGNMTVASPASPTGTDVEGLGDAGGEIIFGKAIDWRQDHETITQTGNASLMWVAAHEMGHDWGLEHDLNGNHIMNTGLSLRESVGGLFPDGIYAGSSSEKHAITYLYASGATRVEPGVYSFSDGATVDLPAVGPGALGISAVKVRSTLEADAALDRLAEALTTLEDYGNSISVTR